MRAVTRGIDEILETAARKQNRPGPPWEVLLRDRLFGSFDRCHVLSKDRPLMVAVPAKPPQIHDRLPHERHRKDGMCHAAPWALDRDRQSDGREQQL